MQNIRVPPGNKSYITEIGNISALNDLDDDLSVDDIQMICPKCARVGCVRGAGLLLQVLGKNLTPAKATTTTVG